MKNLKAKLQNKGGFTLIEMLIVVAIIAILIAVSIPLVGNALERAKKATDAANERAAKAEITIMYLNHSADPTDTVYTKDKTYAYDATSGKMLTSKPDTAYGQCDTHKGQILLVKYDETNHTVIMAWADDYATSVTAGDNLCSKTVGATTK